MSRLTSFQMPKTKQTRAVAKLAKAIASPAPEPPSVCDKADALFRFAHECCRQHRRYSRLVEIEADDDEQTAALRLVALCDELLIEAATAYEQSCGGNGNHRNDEWWRQANALWHACREYARRHSLAERASGEFRAHDANKLAELHVEYDLEASALLALQHAVEAYRKVRPAADLNGAARG